MYPGVIAGDWLLLASDKGSRLLNLAAPDARFDRAIFLESEDWSFANEPLSADGRWLATRKNGHLVLRDLGTQEFPVVFEDKGRSADHFVFSPDNLKLASAVERWVR